MKRLLLFFLLLPFSCLLSCSKKPSKNVKEKTGVNNWFINQRIFPYGSPDYHAYKQAVTWMQQSKTAMRITSQQAWQYAGPENIGGRVVDVEMPPNSSSTIYVCAASGGIFKSTDGGGSWAPIFDGNAALSIGDLAIAPSDSSILYCGTGEANAGGGSVTYDGAGIYKSVNAGASWSYIGLDSTRNTGRIAIDPTNPNRVFAATMGDLFGNGPDRGLYRTLDGGVTWKNVLFANDSTGAIDVAINPQHPDTVFAGLWTRVRRVGSRNYGGAASGIYRSYDGGTTWAKLTNGMPSYDLGRIGIDISQSSPNILYATVTDTTGGNPVILKSTNNGDSWTDVTNNFTGSSYSYWFGRIKIDPANPSIVYEIDFNVWKSTNGGNRWNSITSGIHPDNHKLFINPANTGSLLLGNDGGFFTSNDGGNSWAHNSRLPIMQFYTCDVDEQQPQLLYGGAQDNGVNTTPTGATNDWQSIWGGDGFGVLVDPTNSSNVYAEDQYGDINVGTNGINPNDRTNWNTPFVFNPSNPNALYYGTDMLYKTIDRGNNWNPISPDLTNGSGTGNYPDVYVTITTIANAASDTNVIYIGTDDGNVQVTTNGGGTWNLISSSLPLRWVTHIEVDPRDALSAYATLSGYRYHDSMSHVYHTADGGSTWNDIGANLPDVPVNDIVPDTIFQTLYLCTDIGVFSSDAGTINWQILGTGLPLAPITDLRLHYPTHTLVAATYGRSMYKFDLNILTATTPLPPTSSFSIHVLQNPVQDQLVMTIYSEKTMNASLNIYDMNGKKIMQHDLPLNRAIISQTLFLIP